VKFLLPRGMDGGKVYLLAIKEGHLEISGCSDLYGKSNLIEPLKPLNNAQTEGSSITKKWQ